MEEQIWNYVIGDIHGCYDELLLLEEKIKRHSSKNNVRPFIVSVGDLIDRGPKSNEVVEHFRLGSENKTHAVVMGNHELLMLETIEEFSPENFRQPNCSYPEWFQTYKINYENGKSGSKYLKWEDYQITNRSIWMSQGGYNTLKSYGCEPHDISTWHLPENTLSFLINLPFYWENDNFIVTHALALSEDLQTVQSFKTLINEKSQEKLNDKQTELLRKSVNSLIWNRNIPKLRPHKNKNHISGHTPLKKVKRHNKIACVQIDTACVFGGLLTAICLETNKLIFVKAKKKYHN